MFAKTLVFVCAAFGLVAGSCIELVSQQPSASQVYTIQAPAQSSQVISVPVQAESSSVGIPVVVSSGSFSSGSFSSGSSSSGSSSEIIISGASGSSSLQATNGPETSDLEIIQGPSVTLPAVESPLITLSSPAIPAPRVLSQRCICTKTIVRPQVYQRTVTVPKIQRYLKRTVTPIVENLSYKSTPITQESSSGSSSVVLSSGSQSSGASSVVISSGSQSSGSSKIVLSSGSCPRLC